MEELVQDERLYAAVKQVIQNVYFDLHAIYSPNEYGWYCAAVDLFAPGLTFRVWFTLGEDDQIQVRYAERWHFG